MPEPSDEWKRLNFITTWAIFMIWQRRVSAELPTPWAYRSAAASCGQKRATEQANGKGIKTRWGALIAEALGIAPEQIRPSRYRWDIPGAAWSGICAAFCLSDCHNHLNHENNCYRTPRYVKANAIGVWLKIAHSPEPLTWGLVAANDWNVYLTVSWTRCWTAWKLFWAEAFN